MPLFAFKAANYRAFRETVQAELRPLTLFFGYNNVGKSSLVRLLPWLAESFAPTARGPLSLSSLKLRGASFEEIVHEKPSVTPLSFSLTFGETRASEQTAEFQVNLFQQQQLLFVQSIGLRNAAGLLWFKASYDPTGPDSPALYTVEEQETTTERQGLTFRGLVPEGAGVSEQARKVFRELQSALGEGDLWLDALRSPPSREYKTLGELPARLDPDGQNAPQFLFYDSVLKTQRLIPGIAAWFREHAHLALELPKNGSSFALKMRPIQGTRGVNICDMGEGIGQVLPVLVAGALLMATESAPLLALEQPEIHLHPAMQGAVASYLASAASRHRDARILVETHSHEFLLQLQLEILEGRLKPEDIIIHWVRQNDAGQATLDSIYLDTLAIPRGPWPPGLFSEAVQLARKIAIKRLETP